MEKLCIVGNIAPLNSDWFIGISAAQVALFDGNKNSAPNHLPKIITNEFLM